MRCYYARCVHWLEGCYCELGEIDIDMKGQCSQFEHAVIDEKLVQRMEQAYLQYDKKYNANRWREWLDGVEPYNACDDEQE